MATFKVGDRVRLIQQADDSIMLFGRMVGAEGSILDFAPLFRDCDCRVKFDGHAKPWSCPFNHLAPLLPPAADEWAADKVKSVTKPTYIEPERKVSPMKVTDDIVRRYFR